MEPSELVYGIGSGVAITAQEGNDEPMSINIDSMR